MTDTDPTVPFQPDEIEATRGRERGLGMGARELAAQRDPGASRSADDDAEAEADPDIERAQD